MIDPRQVHVTRHSIEKFFLQLLQTRWLFFPVVCTPTIFLLSDPNGRTLVSRVRFLERKKREANEHPTSQRFVKNERKRRRSCLLITATTQWTLYYIYICIFNAPRGTRLLARTDREQRRKIDVFTDHVTFKISRITHVNEASYSCILEEFLG